MSPIEAILLVYAYSFYNFIQCFNPALCVPVHWPF